MEITRRAERVEEVRFSRFFEDAARPGSGYSFPCTEDGAVNLSEMSDAARANLARCLSGEIDVLDRGVEKDFRRYTVPAEGRCACRATVVLSGFTNTCERCGRDYNMSGQELAPREQWGEETGESLSEVLSIR